MSAAASPLASAADSDDIPASVGIVCDAAGDHWVQSHIANQLHVISYGKHISSCNATTSSQPDDVQLPHQPTDSTRREHGERQTELAEQAASWQQLDELVQAYNDSTESPFAAGSTWPAPALQHVRAAADGSRPVQTSAPQKMEAPTDKHWTRSAAEQTSSSRDVSHPMPAPGGRASHDASQHAGVVDQEDQAERAGTTAWPVAHGPSSDW